MNFVISHIGGVSVTAHRRGKMVDSNDVIHGDVTPWLPPGRARCLRFPFQVVLFRKIHRTRDLQPHHQIRRVCRSLGTSDARESPGGLQNGDQHAKLIYDAMIYQIGKFIAPMRRCSRRCGRNSAHRGISRDEYLVNGIRDMVGFIAPVEVYPGEYEMEALASGALRVLDGEETALTYSGKPVWNGFDFIPQAKD